MTQMKMRNHNLDVMRGISAVIVAYSHLIMKYRHRDDTDFFIEYLYFFTKLILDVGKVGVIVLFALSGYFIIDSLSRVRKRFDRPLTAFMGQRFFRLYPLYWLSLLFGVLLPWDDPNRIFPESVIILNATMLQGFFFVENVIGLYWTLQIELSFYALCVVLFLLGRSDDVRTVCIVTIGLFAFALVLSALRYQFDIKLPVALPLMIGVCFLGSLWKASDGGRAPGVRRHAWAAVGVFYIFLLPICLLAYSRDYGFNETWYRYFVSYATGITVFLAVSRSRKAYWSRIAPLGAAGYAIFLFHPSVYAALDKLGFSVSATGLPPSVVMIVSLVLVVATGFAIKAWIFDPVLARGDAIVASLAGKTRQPATV